MECRAGERLVEHINFYLAPLHTVALVVYVRNIVAVAESGVADGLKAQRQTHALERGAARKRRVTDLADAAGNIDGLETRAALKCELADRA